jgi:hypothetical protein
LTRILSRGTGDERLLRRLAWKCRRRTPTQREIQDNQYFISNNKTG